MALTTFSTSTAGTIVAIDTSKIDAITKTAGSSTLGVTIDGVRYDVSDDAAGTLAALIPAAKTAAAAAAAKPAQVDLAEAGQAN